MKRKRREARPRDVDDQALFRQAMAEVAPLRRDDRCRVPPGAGASPVPRSGPPPGPAAPDAAREGLADGADPRQLRRLRRGELRVEASLDLHGKTTDQAARAARRFLVASRRAGRRVVLIVCGRGRGSPGGEGVLRRWLAGWLGGRLSPTGDVLAYTTALPRDGGEGAVYVLLRR